MTKPFTFEIKDDDSILRDGETRTHRMMMRDSISKPLQDAIDATQAVKVRDAAILDAASRPGFRYANVITDAQRRPFGFGDQVAVPKPPQAAVDKIRGGERCGKAGTMIPAGKVERGERK